MRPEIRSTRAYNEVMKARLFRRRDHWEPLGLAFEGAYVACTAVTLAGLFTSFVDQQFGCPPGFQCEPTSLSVPAPYPRSLLQGQDGTLLLILVSLALLVGLVSFVRAWWPLLTLQLALAGTVLAFVSWDAADAQERIVGIPYTARQPGPIWLTPAPGLYLAIIGSATATAVAILLLAAHLLEQPRGRRWSLRNAAV